MFEFDPVPVREVDAYAGSTTGIQYEANFIALDGSGATLSFNFSQFRPFDPYQAGSNVSPQVVYYDAANNEFGYAGATGGNYADNSGDWLYGPVHDTTFIGFNPAADRLRPGLSSDGTWNPYLLGGGAYQLTEKDGTSYTIDAATGAIEAVADANGNTMTYTYANAVGAAGSVTATDAMGRTLFTVLTNASNEVTSVQIAGQNPITYGYTTGLLTSAVNQVNQQAGYAYTDAQFPSFLTSVTNNIGQQVLGAHYNASSGLLDQLTNPSGITMPVSYDELANGEVAQTVVDAVGNITTDVLDPQFGTLLRKIQAQTDSSGNVLDYIVSLTRYNYAHDDAGVISALRPSGVQVLQSVQNFAPFEIQGSDSAGLRFTQQLAGNAWTAQTTYDTTNDLGSASYQQPLSTSQRITDAGALQTTLYGDYTILATAGNDPDRYVAKPQVTTVEVQTPDASQPTGYDNQVQSQKYDHYDSSGRLEYEVVAAARDFDGGSRVSGVGVYSDVGEGDYPAAIYLTPSGLSIGADNNVTQSVAWNAADSAYEWSDGWNGSGPVLDIKLEDTSLHDGRGGSGTPVGGDAWELTVSDTGNGGSGDLSGLAFDGSPGSLSAIAGAFNAAETGLGLAVPGWAGVGTEYDYASLYAGGPNFADGGVAQTYNITATINPDGSISSFPRVGGAQTQNAYYDANDYTNSDGTWTPNYPGVVFGAVKYSVDAAGQETYYAYNPQGQKLLEYTYKQWTAADGTVVNGWVGKTYVYDAAARLTETYQATYTDTRTATPHLLPVIAGGPAGIQVDTSVCPPYQGADPLRVQHIDYNTLGQIAVITDQYGGQTSYTYDANGNTVRTVYPNGTETRSVYDALNRVTWSTNQYDPSGSNLPILTHSIYNQLGQVVETDTFDGGTIDIGSEPVGTGTVGTATISTTVINGVETPVGGTLASVTKNFFDAAGNNIETIEPSGLRTGSIYTPDGKVLDTGPISSAAPDGGHSVTTYEGVSSNEFSTSDFQVDGATGYTQTLSNQYNATLGLFYTRMVDPRALQTDVYADALGRAVRTVYPDGSFTETLYGIGSNLVTMDQEGEAIATPSGLSIPWGGSEQVDVRQRKSGDTPIPTYQVYDPKGNLVDVYQAAVADMDPASPTYYPNYGQFVNPLTQYAYDTAGNQTSQTDADGHTTSFAFDQNGNQDRQTLPDRQTESSTYNANSQILSSTDFDGNTADYTYFPSGPHAGLLEQVVYAGAPGSGKATQTVTYGYDDLNRK